MPNVNELGHGRLQCYAYAELMFIELISSKIFCSTKYFRYILNNNHNFECGSQNHVQSFSP